jgi:hypothetical protein
MANIGGWGKHGSEGRATSTELKLELFDNGFDAGIVGRTFTPGTVAIIYYSYAGKSADRLF